MVSTINENFTQFKRYLIETSWNYKIIIRCIGKSRNTTRVNSAKIAKEIEGNVYNSNPSLEMTRSGGNGNYEKGIECKEMCKKANRMQSRTSGCIAKKSYEKRFWDQQMKNQKNTYFRPRQPGYPLRQAC